MFPAGHPSRVSPGRLSRYPIFTRPSRNSATTYAVLCLSGRWRSGDVPACRRINVTHISLGACTIYRLPRVTRTLKQEPAGADDWSQGQAREAEMARRRGVRAFASANPRRSREQSGSLLLPRARSKCPVGAVARAPRPCCEFLQRPRTGCLATEQARCDIQGSAAGCPCAASDHVSRIRALAAGRHDPGPAEPKWAGQK